MTKIAINSNFAAKYATPRSAVRDCSRWKVGNTNVPRSLLLLLPLLLLSSLSSLSTSSLLSWFPLRRRHFELTHLLSLSLSLAHVLCISFVECEIESSRAMYFGQISPDSLLKLALCLCVCVSLCVCVCARISVGVARCPPLLPTTHCGELETRFFQDGDGISSVSSSGSSSVFCLWWEIVARSLSSFYFYFFFCFLPATALRCSWPAPAPFVFIAVVPGGRGSWKRGVPRWQVPSVKQASVASLGKAMLHLPTAKGGDFLEFPAERIDFNIF